MRKLLALIFFIALPAQADRFLEEFGGIYYVQGLSLIHI